MTSSPILPCSKPLISIFTASPQQPRTPRPPFSPPKRHSSLAFSVASKNITLPATTEQITDTSVTHTDEAHTRQSNIGRKRALASPAARDEPSPRHVANMQNFFERAKTNLHLDMHVASSPLGSLESRLFSTNASPENDQAGFNSIRQPTLNQEGNHLPERYWRYSTAPQSLAMSHIDVREPLPSPTLPSLPLVQSGSHSDVKEPVSSGFTTPTEQFGPTNLNSDDFALPPLPPSTPLSRSKLPIIEADDIGDVNTNSSSHASNLEQPMTALKLTGNPTSSSESMEESPILSHLQKRLLRLSSDDIASDRSDSHKSFIYLSESAQAAAESAKTKRRQLKEESHHAIPHRDPILKAQTALDLSGNSATRRSCIDQDVREGTPMILCPDPLIHTDNNILLNNDDNCQGFGPLRSDLQESVRVRSPMFSIPFDPYRRTTAAGSPMPFARARLRPQSSGMSSMKPYHQHTSGLQNPESVLRHVQPSPMINEHFASGWYYAQEGAKTSTTPVYSFSTAASKVVGSDQAPDSRIRDSYRTNTLTALAKPPSRFRKNGIAANLGPRGVSRFYGRPQSCQRPATSGMRPASKMSTTDDVRFRSSPPRSVENSPWGRFHRHRNIPVCQQSTAFGSNLHGSLGRTFASPFYEDDESQMIVDEDTSAAVRYSILDDNTSDSTYSLRQGMRELSPNVVVLRKGMQMIPGGKIRRRPSYWDNDLREVRESPAGRGGVNSPVSAQQSMKAEVEMASMRDCEFEVDVDENDLSGEVTRASIELDKKLEGMMEVDVSNLHN